MLRRWLLAFWFAVACSAVFSAVATLPACGTCRSASCATPADVALASWNDTPTRHAIEDFVRRVTARGSPEHVAPAERIAVIDNDGTLWTEQPEYPQVLFMMDRARELAPGNPGWNDTEPFRSMLAGDPASAFQSSPDAFKIALEATFGGMTVDEFHARSRQWLAGSRNSKWGRFHGELVFQPMIELLDYLRGHGFKVFIVTGGDTEFTRVFAEELYGVPPEQVIGTSMTMIYQQGEHGPEVYRRPLREYGNDREEKVVGIQRQIGRRPILAVGNSQGDRAMVEWTTAGAGARLGMFVHHTDAEREWAYDRASRIGRLDGVLDEAASRGWVIIDMKGDWATVFPK
ncbi:MAG: haloacid dehalogenase-like hydrolase [Phycisphaerae bacterium]|nr:haloacid dehalogenase-like hydrolase [Phycisphaerae bacterium]